jgi:hypothetical protein
LSATTDIAIYAAVIASGGLGWQVWTHVQRRRPVIRVELRHAGQPPTDPNLAGKLIYEVTVAAVNTGETTETVEAIGFLLADEKHGMDDRPILEPLPPGGVVRRSFELLALPSDPRAGIVPYVEIASSPERISGKQEELVEYLMGECWAVYVPNVDGSR